MADQGSTSASTPRFEAPSAGRIALAGLAALVIAGLLLVVAVLPAEYGIDPLGTGKRLGLTSLAEVRPTTIVPQPGVYHVDSTNFVLGAYQAVEYKYRIEKGGTMLFSWAATGGDVLYDKHSEPAGGPAGYAESFDRREANEAHGTYTAPFSGIHGWYWENPGGDEITVRLSASGFFKSAREFHYDGTRRDVDLAKAPSSE